MSDILYPRIRLELLISCVSVTKSSCFRASPTRTIATDLKIQRGFEAFLCRGNTEKAPWSYSNNQLWEERLMRLGSARTSIKHNHVPKRNLREGSIAAQQAQGEQTEHGCHLWHAAVAGAVAHSRILRLCQLQKLEAFIPTDSGQYSGHLTPS